MEIEKTVTEKKYLEGRLENWIEFLFCKNLKTSKIKILVFFSFSLCA